MQAQAVLTWSQTDATINLNFNEHQKWIENVELHNWFDHSGLWVTTLTVNLNIKTKLEVKKKTTNQKKKKHVLTSLCLYWRVMICFWSPGWWNVHLWALKRLNQTSGHHSQVQDDDRKLNSFHKVYWHQLIVGRGYRGGFLNSSLQTEFEGYAVSALFNRTHWPHITGNRFLLS